NRHFMLPSRIKAQAWMQPMGSSGYQKIDGLIGMPFVSVPVREFSAGSPAAGNDGRYPVVIGSSEKGLLAVSGMAGDCNFLLIHLVQGIEIIHCPMGTPGPRHQRAPVMFRVKPKVLPGIILCVRASIYQPHIAPPYRNLGPAPVVPLGHKYRKRPRTGRREKLQCEFGLVIFTK